MSFDRPLRGSCQCGRNLYIIQLPQAATPQTAQVLFTSQPSQAYLRVPLPWYHSLTLPLNETETRSQIHRVYTTTATTPTKQSHHQQQQQQQEAEAEQEEEERTTKMRHFCGFCGTPLSYWSEHDAEFIQLDLGSLLPRDLADLEELGFLPSLSSGSSASEGEEEDDGGEQQRQKLPRHGRKQEPEGVGEQEEVVVMGRVGAVPWFDGLVEGSRLGRVCKEAAVAGEGRVRVEWEVVEWTEEEDGEGGGERAASPRKRKLGEV